MMRLCSQSLSVFSSKPFKFVVEEKPFYIHESLISRTSAPLGSMITGHMKEAQQGFAVLSDVTESTFARFVSWLYGKDYTAASFTTFNGDAGSAEASRTPKRESIDEDWNFSSVKKKKKKKGITVRTALKEKFITWDDEEYDVQPVVVRSNRASDEDFTDVFLSHAQLYVFAEKYDVQELKQLALRKLRHTLASFTLYRQRLEDVLTLVRYVYAETARDGRGKEDMRSTLMFYVSTEMDLFEEHGGFKDLLTDDPEMLSDFLAVFATRINMSS